MLNSYRIGGRNFIPGSCEWSGIDPAENTETADSGNREIADAHEGRADLTILPGELETLIIEPLELTLAAGSSHKFAAFGMDQYGSS